MNSARFAAIATVSIMLAAPTTVHAQGGLPPNERVSVSNTGTQARGASGAADISSNGRYVAFSASADNLVRGDTNGAEDVFVRDRRRDTTVRVSVSSRGAQADAASHFPAISGRGRYVAFQSAATNLVRGDDNGATDVFVHNLRTGETTRISVASDGAQANGLADRPAISSDGRHVSFRSAATNLVDGDTNGFNDAFVHDRTTGETTRVSVSSEGAEASSHSFATALSANGRYVAFDSGAGNLVANDLNGEFDAFVHDRNTGTTTRVTLASSGVEADDGGGWPDLSANGRYVAFTSRATNLVPGDTNLDVNGANAWDVFVHDRRTGRTRRVSVASDGTQGDSRSTQPSISPDGRYVAFSSYAHNLVPDDADAQEPDPLWGHRDFDLFVHDRHKRMTRRVSVTDEGCEAEGMQFTVGFPRLSNRGREVAFTTTATNLVRRDTNDATDVFVRELGASRRSGCTDPGRGAREPLGFGR